MSLDDVMEKLKDMEEYISQVNDDMYDCKTDVLKVLGILEGINEELYYSNPDVSADLDNAIELLKELIDEE
ncbi:hypothetical protein Z969_09535 [Clostridium novyi A str. 4570]|uniref:Uncharacterized protein n=1 Tax=Clostridium novyi A str. 4570 TaxID=1444290 RepID=A0AA88ZLS1_CLONO|nr:hypothetical protein [Clostridium novyi]KGN00752.1 hypothetical protein Z969_09535 [Clostridium novyi A str. 4570]